MKRRAYILGAGVTGLSTGWKLAQAGFQVTVVEREAWIGGQAATFQRGDYRFDLGPHKLFTLMDDIMESIRDLLGDDLLTRPKVGKIYFQGQFVNFPIGPRDMIGVFSLRETARCLASFLAAYVAGKFSRRNPTTYEEWIISHFGNALYRKVVQPCTEKIWGESATLGLELAQTRIRVQSLAELIKEFLFRIKPGRVVNTPYFYYPRCGIGMLPDRIAQRITQMGGEIHTRLAPVKISVREGQVCGIIWSGGRTDVLTKDDVLISTIPKRDLLSAMDVPPNADIKVAVDALRERSLILLFMMLRKDKMSDYSWIFFPEKEFIFNRVFEQSKCSPSMVPRGKTLICAEITCKLEDSMWRKAEKHLFQTAVNNLESAGLLEKRDIMDHFEVRLAHAYPIWDIHSARNLETVLDFIEGYENLYSVGRQGGFTYGGSADCMDIGFRTARHIIQNREKEEWRANRRQFHSYVVID